MRRRVIPLVASCQDHCLEALGPTSAGRMDCWPSSAEGWGLESSLESKPTSGWENSSWVRGTLGKAAAFLTRQMVVAEVDAAQERSLTAEDGNLTTVTKAHACAKPYVKMTQMA